MRDWALSILGCVQCRGRLARDSAQVVCVQCGHAYPTIDDVTDFTSNLHPTPAREREAVHGLDGSLEAAGPLPALLGALVTGGALSQDDLRAFPCLEHARTARDQIRHLLARRPLPPGAVVVEIGADHGWLSSLLVANGCRVIASDITTHLRLAPAADSPNLCRVYADMNRLPVADASADVFWATAAVHHSWDVTKTFAEAARILKPGGRIYLCCEPMPGFVRYMFGHGFGRAERDLGINEQWIPRWRWLALSRQASFEPELVFPDLDATTVQSKLTKRGLPAMLAPFIAPLMRSLQVSIHLVADKAPATAPPPAAR